MLRITKKDYAGAILRDTKLRADRLFGYTHEISERYRFVVITTNGDETGTVDQVPTHGTLEISHV